MTRPGHLFVVEPERRHGSLAELYVMPQARGARPWPRPDRGLRGLGAQRGHKLLTVGVLAKNARAIRSYEGAGFSPYTSVMRRYL